MTKFHINDLLDGFDYDYNLDYIDALDNFDKQIFLNNLGYFHRIDGPALETGVLKAWCINGSFHREDGPAIERYDGDNEWWFHGIKVNVSSQEDFERHIKLIAFI